MKIVKDIYIFIGPPGSGKGSLSHLCKKKLGLTHLSTGNLCRQHITRMTDIGIRIDRAIKSGKLIDDDLMVEMVSSWIPEAVNSSAGIILDGFPRTVAQARALDALFSREHFKGTVVTVVAMNINDDHVVDRLRARFVCEEESCQAVYSFTPKTGGAVIACEECGSTLVQRTDDKSDVVYERLRVYHRYADDLLKHYRDSSYRVIDLNVEFPLEHVFKTFIESTGKST